MFIRVINNILYHIVNKCKTLKYNTISTTNLLTENMSKLRNIPFEKKTWKSFVSDFTEIY